VSFEDPASAEKALAEPSLSLDGRRLELKAAIPRGLVGSIEAERALKPRKIFVAGLNELVSEADLRDHFSQYGRISEAVIQKDRSSGTSRGFGFVTFDDPDSVDRVLVKGSQRLGDKCLVDVKIARPKELPPSLGPPGASVWSSSFGPGPSWGPSGPGVNSGSWGPSSQYGGPSSHYGGHNSFYGGPPSQYGGHPSSQYRGPPPSQYGGQSTSGYGGPPSSQYGSSQYGSSQYGSSQYGSSQYGGQSTGYSTTSDSFSSQQNRGVRPSGPLQAPSGGFDGFGSQFQYGAFRGPSALAQKRFQPYGRQQ